VGDLRVMQVIARMNVGGPAALLVELARGLDSQHFSVLLATGECGPGEEDFLLTQAPEVAALRIPHLGRKLRPWGDLVALFALIRAIREFQPHVVHTHTAKAGVLGRLAVKLSGSRAKVVHTYHGHLLYGYFRPWFTRIVVQIERALARISDVLLAVGQQVKVDLLLAGVGRHTDFRVINPGVAVNPPPTKTRARADLGINADDAVIGVVGRITAIKRPDRVLDVIAQLGPQFPDACVIMAGSGDLAAQIEQDVATRSLPVRMLGWRDDVERVLAACDLVLLTSDNEGTPLSLIQAALLGVPAVAVRVGSVPEVVLDRETGIVVDPSADDTTEIAAAVGGLLSEPRMRVSLGAAARQYAQEHFSVAQYVAKHAELYAELSARK